ncbi:MAG: hypothetical protein LBK12_08045, partial [Odoribacteraceae bacterium]|nr:hypothetical protein [Odoribacteraceae bacterium]
DYDLNTPWRLIASAAVVLNRRVIVSGEYEYVDYPSANVKDTYHGEYDWIRDFFKYNTRAAHNFRVGVEYRANSLFSLRGGYSYNGSPYDKGDWNAENDIQTLSTGLGFNFGSCYVDVAYLYKSATDTDYFYNYVDPNHADNPTYHFSSDKIKTTSRNSELRCSFGVKF